MTQPVWPVDWPIGPSKTTAWLLNESHVEDGPKARFFSRFGFTKANPDALAYAVLNHPTPQTFARETLSARGDVKFIFEGPRCTPDGRAPVVRTVWRIDTEHTAHYVTAVPLTN